MVNLITKSQKKDYHEFFWYHIKVLSIKKISLILHFHIMGWFFFFWIGNGSIDFEEFVLMMADKLERSNTEDEIREAFKLFDKDDNGYISVSELKNILTETGEKITPEEANELIKAIDKDGDGKIDYEGI